MTISQMWTLHQGFVIGFGYYTAPQALSGETLTAWQRTVVQINEGESQTGVDFRYCGVDSVL